MPSILTAEYIPIDEIVPPEETSRAQLRGTVAELNILRGGFVYASAYFGITDDVDNLLARRTPTARLAKQLSRDVLLTGLTSDGNSLVGSLTVKALLQKNNAEDTPGVQKIPDWVNEIAGKMACVSYELEHGLPLFTTNYLIRDTDIIPSFHFRQAYLDASESSAQSIPVPRFAYEQPDLSFAQ